jgi:hypothetical protein
VTEKAKQVFTSDRRRGRPRLFERSSSVTVWVPTSLLDTLHALARRLREENISRLHRELLEEAIARRQAALDRGEFPTRQIAVTEMPRDSGLEHCRKVDPA